MVKFYEIRSGTFVNVDFISEIVKNDNGTYCVYLSVVNSDMQEWYDDIDKKVIDRLIKNYGVKL